MRISDLRDAIRSAQPLSPDETLARAIRRLRAHGLPALPVADQGRLIGLLHERDLAVLVASAADPRADLQRAVVSDVMRPIALVVRDEEPVPNLIHLLQQEEAAALPVAAADGRYRGMVLRRDLLAAISGHPAAPPIAGLATPFGVRLTTGALRAGAGNLALAATGASLMVLNLLADGAVYALARLADWLLGPAGGPGGNSPSANLVAAVLLLFGALQVVIFLLLLRLSPLTGVHAAEHMVVHAIEEGEDLTPEKVRPLSRIHPRCGTNLMALLILLVIAQQFLSSFGRAVDETTGSLVLLVLVMIVLLTWRRLGAWLQTWVTTRRPTDRQLDRALQVGQALLDEIRARPGARATAPQRIWNSGLLQVMTGFFGLMALVEFAQPLLAAAWSRLAG